MNRFCTYCGGSYTSTKLSEHQKNCESKPKPKPPKPPKITKAEKLHLRLVNEVRDISDIPRLLKEIMLEEGYQITFTSIPSNFLAEALHQNYGVMFPNDQGVYAGWRGQWRGVIEPIAQTDKRKRKKKSISFSDLNSYWSDSSYSFSFLKTSSGCPADKFDISGYILVDDFPHLHKLYLKDGFKQRYNAEINANLIDIKASIMEVKKSHIYTNPELIDVKAHLKTTKAYTHNLEIIVDRITANLNAKFKSEHKIVLPEIDSPFIDMGKYLELQSEYQNQGGIEIDDESVKSEIEALKKTFDNMKSYIDKYAEFLI